MATYEFKCPCGDATTVEADTKEAAIEMIKAEMTEEKVKMHMEEKHSGDPVPSMEDLAKMIEEGTHEVQA